MRSHISIHGLQNLRSSILVGIVMALCSVTGILWTAGFKSLSGVGLLYLVAFGIFTLRKYGGIQELVENFLLYFNLSVFLVYLTRELDWIPTSFVTPITFLSIFLLVLVPVVRHIRTFSQEVTASEVNRVCVSSLICGTVTSGFYLASLHLPTHLIVRWLGYGYDNYGHLAHARAVFIEHQTFYLHPFPELGILSSTAQASSALLSGGHTIFSGSPNTEAWLHTYSVACLCLLLGTAVLFVPSIARGRSKSLSFALGLSFVLVLVFGHLGRVWVNGFFASNFATFAFCLFLTNNCRRQSLSVYRGTAQIAMIMSTWPLLGMAYSVVASWWLLPNLKRIHRKLKSQNFRGFNQLLRDPRGVIQILAMCAALLQAFLTYRAIRRGYSFSQFFSDGGIEPANASAYLACCSLLVVAVFVLQPPGKLTKEMGIAGFLLLIAMFILAISIIGRGYVNYYATKTVVGVVSGLVCLVVAIQSQKLKDEITRLRQLLSVVVVIGFALIQIYQAPSKASMTFTGSFQGRVFNSFVDVVREEPGPLHVEAVSVSIDGFCSSRPALYISKHYDSELTTRWINSLRGLWNDSNWGTWMKIRSLITKDTISRQDWASADALIAADKFILIIDETSFDVGFVDDLSENLPKALLGHQVCLI